jgi:hypothetical protein
VRQFLGQFVEIDGLCCVIHLGFHRYHRRY